jgi:hypothetical protein
MWHDLFVEQITLSEKVIRTIEDSEGQLTRPGLAGFSTSLTLYGAGTWSHRAARFLRATHSAHVGLLIGALGVGRVLGCERVEDELRGGVSIGTRAISLGV